MSFEELDAENEDLVTVFMGDLHNCRERLSILADEGIPSAISGDIEGMISEFGPPVLTLQVRRSDIEDVIEIFEEVWQEILDTEGLETRDVVMDFNQEMITCPGCQTETEEVTPNGECPECGLFLGFPEDNEDDEDPDAYQDIDEDDY